MLYHTFDFIQILNLFKNISGKGKHLLLKKYFLRFNIPQLEPEILGPKTTDNSNFDVNVAN